MKMNAISTLFTRQVVTDSSAAVELSYTEL